MPWRDVWSSTWWGHALEVSAYDGATRLGSVGAAFDVEWVDPINEPGAASFSIAANDAAVAHLDYQNLCRITVDGVDRFTFVIEAKAWLHDDAGNLTLKVSGRNALALLDSAVIYHEGGLRPTGGDERPFGFMNANFDDTGWSTAAPKGTQANPDNPGWAGSPEAWPDPDASWVWTDPLNLTVAPGFAYFRTTMTLATPMDVKVFASADDEFTLWIDNEVVLEATGPFQWTRTHEEALSLPAGDHTVAIRGRNLLRPSGNSPAAVLLSIIQVQGDGTFHDPPNILLRTSSTWKALGYPDPPPGVTPGGIVGQLLSEAQARGVLGAITSGFSATADSGGTAWPDTVDFGFQIGSSYLWAVEQLAELAVDVHMTPKLQLNMWHRRGTDRTASLTFTLADNLTGASWAASGRIRNVVLTRSTSGWAQYEHAASLLSHDRGEAFLSIGTTQQDSSQHPVDAAFDMHALPAVEGTLELDGTVDPYFDFELGDWITVQNPAGGTSRFRILSISGRQTPADHVDWSLEVESD